MNAKKQTVLITGSSRGLGYAMAEAFGRAGYSVIINGRDKERLETARAALATMGCDVAAIPADAADYDQAKSLFARPADIVVNNTGVSHYGLFQDMTPPEWTRLIQTDLLSVFNICHLALPHMLAQKRGVILNMASVWGVKGASCEAVYSAAKAGVIGFTQALARELGPSGIRVNALSCGVMDTGMNARFSADEKREMADSIPLGRFGRPEEAAAAALFLASDGAAYINGQNIVVDGGFI